MKRHAVDRLDHAGAGEEVRAQVADLEGRRVGHSLCSRGFSTSRSWSPTRLMATMVISSAMPGIEADPVLARQHVLEAVGDQQAERGLGDRHAEAEEGQRGLQRDGARDLHACRRRSAAAGSSAAGGGTRCAASAAPGTAPPRCIPCGARPARRRARCARSRPIRTSDQRDDDLVDALAEDGQEHQRHQDRREGELQVDQAHDQRVDPAAGIGREQPERRCRPRRRSAPSRRRRSADAQAVEDRRQHVAALVVGAEPDR